MILLDTNVLVYASDQHSSFCNWARNTIVGGVSSNGAAINAITLAELCAGAAEAKSIADQVRSWGISVLDVPAVTAVICAEAYRRYRERRLAESGKPAPSVPLPDFFIGAHAVAMGWELATADKGRFSTYFPSLVLVTPH